MEQLETMLLSPADNLRKVLEVINQGGRGVALVVDDDRRLLGLVTDGDVRRALIGGLDFRCSGE